MNKLLKKIERKIKGLEDAYNSNLKPKQLNHIEQELIILRDIRADMLRRTFICIVNMHVNPPENEQDHTVALFHREQIRLVKK